VGHDVFSPTYHTAFSPPRELCAFIAQLRELSGGKPVGFKICIGDPREFMAIVKAMIETDTFADFIVVDGGEGGTGAAPLEFSNAMGSPLIEGLLLVQATLVGAGIRDRMRIGASGKMVTAGAITGALALGADWCNSARAFMMSVGCIQAQRCHTNRCPVGVTTQDKKLQRALDVPDKSQRVYHFHRNTVHAVAEMTAAMGLDHPTELRPEQVDGRRAGRVMRFAEMHDFAAPGDLLANLASKQLQSDWDAASPDTFKPHAAVAGPVS
jgi:glutamate synthase domain-containing protein 2